MSILSVLIGSIAASTSPSSLVVKVASSGGTLIDGNNNFLQLRGGNMYGLEFVAVDNLTVSNWGGIIPNWATYATWKPNVARIPLNAASWLGLTTYDISGYPATSWGAARNSDPQGNYRQTVYTAIAAAQAIGCYVIIDLHWSAPQVTLGGVTHYISASGQPEFMNSSTDITFWTSIANTFGTQATPQPGITNSGILFELFNEPYIDFNQQASTAYSLMKNGGTVSTFHGNINGWSVSPAGGVGVAGYQQALNAIRATGAHNVCIINGGSFAQQAKEYLQWFPTDTLSPPQLAAGWHPYPTGDYPYSDGDIYGLVGGDPGSGTASFSQWFEAIISAGIPVIITEDGGTGGPTLSPANFEPHVAYMTAWADTHKASYVSWQWNQSQSGTTTFCDTTISDGNIIPINGQGVVNYNWLVNHT